MAEDRGGLDYNIDVSGDFDRRIDSFIAKVQALNGEIDKLGKKATGAASPQTAVRKNSADTRAAKEQYNYSNKTLAVQRAIKRLEDRLEVLRSSEVSILKGQVDQQTKIEKVSRRALKNDEQALQYLKDRKTVAKFIHDQQVRATAASEQEAKAEVQRRNAVRATQQKQFDQLQAEEKARVKAQSDRARAVAAGREQITQAEAITLAKERQLKADNALAVKQAQINQLVQTQGVSQRRAAELVGLSSAQAKQMGLNMWDAEHAARQFLFTFRRLVGILAIFTLAREFAAAIGQGVREMIRFNAELESAQIGIASIVASAGRVYDAQGQLLTGQEAFNGALLASDNIIKQLKQDAVGSIATFEALVKSYQVAIGPGLSSGLNLQQIKELSNGLTEGAIRMGVPLNQLSEEIRSLLQGTATARNTRLAALFGGATEANAAIRAAKEQGRLYEVLMERLAGVEAGADAAAYSMDVLRSNLQDSVQLLLSEGGIQYFNELKDTMLALSKAVVSFDASGPVFSPQALGIVQDLAGTLQVIISNFREFTNTTEGLLSVQNVLRSLRGAMEAVAPLATTLFSGLVAAVNAVLGPISLLLQAVGALNQALARSPIGKFFLTAFKYAAATYVSLVAWYKIFKQIGLLVGAKGLLGAFKTVAHQIDFALFTIKQTNGQLTITNILTAIWNKQMDAVALKTSLATAGISAAVGLLVYLVARMTVLRKRTADAADEAGRFEGFITSASEAQQKNVKTAEDWADALRNARIELQKAQLVAGLQGDAKELASLYADAVGEIAKGTEYWREQKNVAEDALAASQKNLQGLEKQLEDLKNSEDSLSFELQFNLRPDTPEEAQARLLQTVQELQGVVPPIDIVSNIDALKQADLLKKTQDDIRDTENSILQIKTQEEELQKKITEAGRKQLEILDLQVRAYKAENPEALRSLEIARNTEAVNKLLTESASVRFSESAKEYAQKQASYSLLKAQIDLERTRRRLEVESANELVASAVDLGASEETIKSLRQQALDLNNRDLEVFRQEEASLKASNEELERRTKLLAGDVSTVLSEGLFKFSQELPALGEQVADIISGSLSDVATVVADVFKDAIDPRTSPDLKTAFGEFFLNLAGQMVEAMTQQLINSAILKIGLGADDVLPDVALQTNTTATELNTQQLLALNGILQTMGGLPIAGQAAPVVPATTVPDVTTNAGNTAAATAASSAGGFLGGLGTIAPWLAALFIPLIIGLLTKAFAKGGQVQAFASGGDVNKLPRPSYIPASDTVPAWLTPGEFVIRKEAVQKYGRGILDMINNGILNPAVFGTSVMPAIKQRQSGIRAFAQGGAVSAQAAGRAGNRGSGMTVLPVLPATNNTLEQIIAGGRTSFAKGVNRVDYVGDPNRSGRWR